MEIWLKIWGMTMKEGYLTAGSRIWRELGILSRWIRKDISSHQTLTKNGRDAPNCSGWHSLFAAVLLDTWFYFWTLLISARENDFRPSRLEVTKTCLEQFIVDYFDQNPISQLSLALTRDRGAEKVTDLSGRCLWHIHRSTLTIWSLVFTWKATQRAISWLWGELCARKAWLLCSIFSYRLCPFWSIFLTTAVARSSLCTVHSAHATQETYSGPLRWACATDRSIVTTPALLEYSRRFVEWK